MARKKIPIDRDILEQAITQVEGGRNPPSSLNALYVAVGELLGRPAGVVKGRIEDYGLTLKTQPGRTRKSSKKTPSPPIRTEKTPILDLTPYTKRGIRVTSLGDLFTSSLKDDETNRAIMSAIVEIRQTYGLPALSSDDFRRLKKEKGD